MTLKTPPRDRERERDTPCRDGKDKVVKMALYASWKEEGREI